MIGTGTNFLRAACSLDRLSFAFNNNEVWAENIKADTGTGIINVTGNVPAITGTVTGTGSAN
jgi:hypothetical protein